MYLSSLPCVLHVQPTSSSLNWIWPPTVKFLETAVIQIKDLVLQKTRGKIKRYFVWEVLSSHAVNITIWTVTCHYLQYQSNRELHSNPGILFHHRHLVRHLKHNMTALPCTLHHQSTHWPSVLRWQSVWTERCSFVTKRAHNFTTVRSLSWKDYGIIIQVIPCLHSNRTV